MCSHNTLTMTLWSHLCVCILLSVALNAMATSADTHSNDITSLLGSLDDGGQSEQDAVGVLWGIADTTATVGKAFHYSLPSGAFKGPVAHYQVTEAGKDSLPSWLHFDADTNSLKGVATPDDLGHQVYIQVTAQGQGDKVTPTQAKDIFAIKVVEDNVHSESTAVPLKEVDAEGLQPIKCPAGSSVTMATVVIDAEGVSMSGHDRLRVMEGMCGHLKMPMSVVRLLPVGNKPMFDSSALVAGPGDVSQPKHTGLVMEWEVGCGNVHAAHMPILTKLESTASDGSMSNAIGHGVIGWHVTNNKPHSPKRLKRQAIHPTQTPGVTGGPPTGRPIATVTVTDKDMPTTRDIPSMASPTFTDIQPTSTKSRHRTKTRGRHQHHKTKQPKVSPTPTRTAVPTASITPIMPTRVVEATATLDPGVSHVQPSYVTPSPGVSRTVDLIEPSIMHTSTASASGPTEVLPTSTYTASVVTTKEPIKPTEPVMPPSEAVTTTTTTEPPIIIPTEKFNFPPTVKQYLRPYRIISGNILNFTIPEETFNDYEDGNTRNLKLLLLTIDGLTIPPISWIRLDEANQRLYGLPREQHIGKHEYLLAVIDKDGKVARLVFEMIVERPSRDKKINHEFNLVLDKNYVHFVSSVDEQIALSQKIAGVYGDKDTSMMTVTRIEQGSVQFAWTNNSIATDQCPVREIYELLRYLITPENTLNDTLVEALKPDKIMKAEAVPKGACGEVLKDQEGTPTQPSKNGEGEEPDDKRKGENEVDIEKELRETSDDDVLITTVVPAVVIAAMLLLAGLIACILYRKKRKGKLSDEDQHTFINKGIPIIFSDELDDRPDHPTKPLILADEKPPLPPPDYPRSASGSVLSTPRSDHKEPLIDQVTTDDEGDMSPYHPPPPVTGSLGSRGSRGRGNQPAAYRAPPPYVPP